MSVAAKTGYYQYEEAGLYYLLTLTSVKNRFGNSHTA